MAVRRKVLWWVGVPLALVLVAGVVAYMAYLSVQDKPSRTLVFPDGSRLTVLGTSLGNQTFTTDKPWQALLRRWLPVRWQGWLPVPFTSPPARSSNDSMPTNNLAVWFTYVDARGSNITTRMVTKAVAAEGRLVPVTSWPWTSAAAEAADGFRFEAFQNVNSSTVNAYGGKTRVWQFWLNSFPRRQREFELAFFDKDTNLLGSVRVPNPQKGPFPEWTAERLPISRTNGPLVVTLLSVTENEPGARSSGVRAGPVVGGGLIGGGRGGRGAAALDQTFQESSSENEITWTFRLSSADSEWQQVTAPRGRWSDASGNTRGPLDPMEKAWKLSFDVRRPRRTTFSEEERFVLSGLQLPEPGTLQVLTNEFERLGMKFKFRCLAGVGTLAVTNNGGVSLIVSNGVSRGGASSRSLSARSDVIYVSTSLGLSMGGAFAYSGPMSEWDSHIISAGTNFVHLVTLNKPSFLLEGVTLNSAATVRFRVVDSDGNELLAPRPATSASASMMAQRATVNHPYLVGFDDTDAGEAVALEVTFDRSRTFELFIDPMQVKRTGR